ncbi:MAG: HD domain-containing protein [Candidatus Cardinium sp.]|nr:MAG: HD domain-containing protein [Candidatus Cardinium sp.]
MISFNFSLLIVSAFFLLILLVGLYFSSKQTSFRRYAVGSKDFATATLVATVLATVFGGGGFILNIGCTYELGLWWIIAVLLDTFGLWIISKLALHMGPFMEHLSMAETIGHIYGHYPRIIAALAGICNAIVIITMQITAITQAIGICLKIEHPYIMPIFATLLLTFYATFGGIRAVTFIDVLQFITFAIIIPLLAWFIFLQVDKPVPEIVPMLQGHTRFQFSSLFHFDTKLIAILCFVLSNLASYIDAPIIQRVYMSADPIQAQKVFSYATIFNLIIKIFIILTGLLVFAGVPDLPKENIWDYMMVHVPSIFQGFLAIGLLTMSMSKADSYLNGCVVMVSHDIVQSLQGKKEITDSVQLKIARWTTPVVSLLAMFLAFRCQNLLKLIYWSLFCAVPIIAAPFTLAIFGFRGTSRTALIGMATGAYTLAAWNKWVEPAIKIDGSLIAMVTNGLAMMAAHYLFKQPEGTGWVKPDNNFKQIQQAYARKQAKRKERMQHAWANRKITLTKLVPSDAALRLTGLYIITTAILGYWFIRPDRIYWAIFQGLVGVLFTSSKTFFRKAIPPWLIGLGWLIGVAVYLPLTLLRHWWYLVDPIFTASLSLTHCVVILSVLPLYLAIGMVSAIVLGAIYAISTALPLPVASALFPLFTVSLLVFAMVVCFKIKANRYLTKILYLESQEKIRASQKLKASLYDSAMVPVTTVGKAKGYGAILTQVIAKVEESISFLDGDMPLYKQDFQSIINKLYDWVAYFNRSARAKKHALLQPTKITLDKLMRKVELALSQELADPPRLFVEQIKKASGEPSRYIVCDINQVVYLLVQAVLRIGKLEGSKIVRIQLHPTALQFKQADPIDSSGPTFLLFQATALVVSPVTIDLLPTVKELYEDSMDPTSPQGKKEAPPSIDLQQDTISSMVRAHYGYVAYPVDGAQKAIVLVLPSNVTEVRNKMTAKLPLDCLTSEAPVTSKEQADSMMALMQFHDYVCKSLCPEDPIDIGTISGLLLLLRQHFGFKRHASGQLFYVRAVGIAQLVIEWVFHSPKVIYAALLYELVRHTCLPLSYVQEHYNLGVYAFVLNVVGIDKRQELDHPSLLYVQNRLKEAIKEDHVQLSVLFIKLAERLYDLRHAAGYIHLKEMHHMVQETLTIDVKLAHAYLDPEIAVALEKAAKAALAVYKDTDKDQDS